MQKLFAQSRKVAKNVNNSEDSKSLKEDNQA